MIVLTVLIVLLVVSVAAAALCMLSASGGENKIQMREEITPRRLRAATTEDLSGVPRMWTRGKGKNPSKGFVFTILASTGASTVANDPSKDDAVEEDDTTHFTLFAGLMVTVMRPCRAIRLGRSGPNSASHV